MGETKQFPENRSELVPDNKLSVVNPHRDAAASVEGCSWHSTTQVLEKEAREHPLVLLKGQHVGYQEGNGCNAIAVLSLVKEFWEMQRRCL